MYKMLKQELKDNHYKLKQYKAAFSRLKEFEKYRLVESKSNTHTYYFKIIKGHDDKEKQYIGTYDNPEVRKIILHKFLKRAIEQGEKNEKYIKKCLDNYKNIDPNVFRESLPKVYQRLPDNVYELLGTSSAENWLATNRVISDLYPEKKIFRTNEGVMVRSKSEMMIMNKYNDYNIPHIYEVEHKINGITMVPDFTLYHPTQHREIIHEHFGRIDDDDYMQRNCLWKLRNYILGGFIPGYDLIMTFESSLDPLTPDMVDDFIERFFL